MSVLGRIKICEESCLLQDIFSKYWVGGEIEIEIEIAVWPQTAFKNSSWLLV